MFGRVEEVCQSMAYSHIVTCDGSLAPLASRVRSRIQRKLDGYDGGQPGGARRVGEVLAEIKANEDLKIASLVVLTTSNGGGGHPRCLWGTRQLLHHQTGRFNEVHHRGEIVSRISDSRIVRLPLK
jgi:hypothetical protein